MINRKKLSLFIITAIAVLFIVGCEKKIDKPEEAAQSTDTVKAQPDTVKAVEEAPAIDMVGRWSGTFDQRSCTLKVNEGTDSNFTGVITVSYRNPLTKSVSGKIDNEKKEFTMIDTEHSRYKGAYAGTIIEDGTKLHGTYTADLDGKKI